MEEWYLACHKSGRENALKAQIALERMNIAVFTPQIRIRKPRTDRPGQFRQVIEPLFPGYMFIALNPEINHPARIEDCPGISHMVRFAGAITPIREAVVEEIMCLPVCTQLSAAWHKRKNDLQLSTNQRLEIMTLVEEQSGENRNAMFHAFAELLSRKEAR